MEQVWINPVPAVSAASGVYGEVRYGQQVYGSTSSGSRTRFGPSLDINRIRVASEFAPSASPAPPGNAIVPVGWIRQMGAEGETDTSLGDTRGGPLRYDATMTPITVPINSGGWPNLGPGIPQNP